MSKERVIHRIKCDSEKINIIDIEVNFVSKIEYRINKPAKLDEPYFETTICNFYLDKGFLTICLEPQEIG